MLSTTEKPSVSAAELRAALGEFATGVTVVTTRDAEDRPVGLTVNSFSSVSLAPPLVLWSLSLHSLSLAAFRSCTHFAVNVLTAAQVDLARRFASRTRTRWEDVTWEAGAHGVPLLSGCAAFFECRRRQAYAEGDHVIFIGRVERCHREPGMAPLLFHGGRYFVDHDLRTPPD